jgi:uncharacterized protein GlcG (DUF336 family)
MHMVPLTRLLAGVGAGFLCSAAPALADCNGLPTHDALRTALATSIKPTGGPSNGGFDLNMWAAVVDRDGVVCAVVFSGHDRGDQWPGSRVIAAQKANTANAFSLDAFALSSGNLYASNQPGGILFALPFSNPVDPAVAYDGHPQDYGTIKDPMVGHRIGGVNVFGGGLGLYTGHAVVGGLGVSGDSSCADHNVAWRVREALGLNTVPNGPTSNHDDGLIFDMGAGNSGNLISASGFGHVKCGGTEDQIATSIGAAVEQLASNAQ